MSKAVSMQFGYNEIPRVIQISFKEILNILSLVMNMQATLDVCELI